MSRKSYVYISAFSR